MVDVAYLGFTLCGEGGNNQCRTGAQICCLNFGTAEFFYSVDYGGSALGWAFTSGRLAGENAVRYIAE